MLYNVDLTFESVDEIVKLLSLLGFSRKPKYKEKSPGKESAMKVTAGAILCFNAVIFFPIFYKT